jgi:lipopolysaccharide/colanic/teichoic acid biosynthesis glycosyltransferase
MTTAIGNVLDRKASSRKAGRAIRWPQRIPADFTEGVLPERVFLGILSLERKRAERSAKQFLLFLLDAEDIESGPRRDAVLRSLIDALSAARRETDLVGWYKQDSCLGLIFTEIEASNVSAVVDVLADKVVSAVQANVDEDVLAQVHVSVHPFPQQPKQIDWNDRRGPGSRPLYPDLLQREGSKKSALIFKRGMDIVGSALALLLLTPVFAVVALAIKLTSEGPVLFVQERLGQFGKAFLCLKFRTMYVRNDSQIHEEYIKRLIQGAPAAGSGARSEENIYKIQADPRVTRVGHFLRKASLDELPQFLNVLRGQMSLVGPRPPIRYEYDAYDVWHRRRVFEVKPGITGLWQVKGRSQVSFDEMVRLDLRYARSWSIWMDIGILLRTPRAVLSGKGAY